jgi:hypothetical protein
MPGPVPAGWRRLVSREPDSTTRRRTSATLAGADTTPNPGGCAAAAASRCAYTKPSRSPPGRSPARPAGLYVRGGADGALLSTAGADDADAAGGDDADADLDPAADAAAARASPDGRAHRDSRAAGPSAALGRERRGQGLADLGGPRRADGRRGDRPPPGPGTISAVPVAVSAVPQGRRGSARTLHAPPPTPSSRLRGGISRPIRGGSLSRSTDYGTVCRPAICCSSHSSSSALRSCRSTSTARSSTHAHSPQHSFDHGTGHGSSPCTGALRVHITW